MSVHSAKSPPSLPVCLPEATLCAVSLGPLEQSCALTHTLYYESASTPQPFSYTKKFRLQSLLYSSEFETIKGQI